MITIIVIIIITNEYFSAANGAASPSFPAALELPLGFNRSFSGYSIDRIDDVYSSEYDYFVPYIVSSGLVNTGINTTQIGYAFAFGILHQYNNQYSLLNYTALALCAGFLAANHSDNTFSYIVPLLLLSTGPYNASLLVVASESNGKPELQLVDGDSTTVLWSVNNVGMMEILDNGTLLIYDSSLSKVVLQMGYGIKDSYVLLPGQRLMLGQQLTSIDSAYSVRVHTEGMSFDMNSRKYQNTTYTYAFAPFRNMTFNSSDPVLCTDDSTYVSLAIDYEIQSVYSDSDPYYLRGRSCGGGQNAASVFFLKASDYVGYESFNFSFSFVALQTNGSLHLVTIAINASDIYKPVTTKEYQFDSFYSGIPYRGAYASYDYKFFQLQLFQGCDTPKVCGPMGICTSGVKTPCSCPSLGQAFKYINPSDQFQGCEHLQPLPNCPTNQLSLDTTSQISFLQLNKTANMFLFSQSPYFSYSMFGSVDDCKMNCSSTCECQGLIHDPTILPYGGCYFIMEDISSLLDVSQNVTYLAYENHYVPRNPYYGDFTTGNITLTTFLKIVTLNTTIPIGNNTTLVPIHDNKINIKLIVIVIVSSFIAFLFFVGIVLYVTQRRKHKLRAIQLLEERELQNIIPSMVTRFTYKDLYKATQGFSNMLGAGGCGSVYKGALADGKFVAVKMLGSSKVLTKEQSKQFLAELACVGRTSHHNIVRLLGFSWEQAQLLVVYEYIENGSLDQWLFNPVKSSLLDWKTRFNMALGIAQGLHYLHEQCTTPILHFDIKPQNILLDKDFVPKLADFGLSKLVAERDISQVVTGVRGTPGYIAPEWLSHGAVSKKADVYSMGMVLLELVSGRRNIDLCFLNDNLNPSEKEKWHFPSWSARKCEQGFMTEIADTQLQGLFNEAEFQRVVFTSFWCINADPCTRPTTNTILQWLDGVCPISPPNLSSLYAQGGSHIKPTLEALQLTSIDSSDMIPMLSIESM